MKLLTDAPGWPPACTTPATTPRTSPTTALLKAGPAVAGLAVPST
jgi:hypothetical protein